MSAQPPLIVHIIYRLAIGGLENGLVNLLNTMPAERFRHAVVCLAGFTDFRNRIRRKDVQVYSLDKKPGKDFGAYVRCWRLLRRLQPAIVHTRNLGTVDMQWIAAAAGVRKRVHGEHGWEATDPTGSNRKSLTIRRACRGAVHRYVALSGDLARWLQTQVGVDAARIEHIYNGVDTKRFTPEGDWPADWPWPRTEAMRPFVFGTVGRLDGVKNHLGLLGAFASLLIELNQVDKPLGERLRLIIAGDGPMAAALQARVTELNLANRVWLTGARDDVPALLRALDVFVLPSVNEGISNTILEAMASGRPVIATRVGGNPELIDAESTGTLYDGGDERQLVAAMSRYIRTPALIARHAAAARAGVIERFSLQSMVASYERLYQSLLES